MGLQEYRKKRNFKKTTEPLESKASKGGPIFVVQEHHASHLHYDFRLEAFGTLKSWAVPKGPSTAVGDKRLAVEVEDHPISYANFKGRIPEGEYGAGIVKIWDKGTWVPPEDLKENLSKGHLEFELKGKKLKGRWLLQRTKAAAGKKSQWLLIKRHDTEVAKTPKARAATAGVKTKMPAEFAPQLAQLMEQVPTGADWIHETKYDGYRTLVRKDGARSLKLLSRNGHDWTGKYGDLADSFAAIKAKQFVIDGEVVVEDAKGKSSFSLLQHALEAKDSSVMRYYAFDLLFLDGRDLREEKLEIRKQILKDLLKSAKSKNVVFSEHIRGQGEDLYRDACKKGWEGIISKDRNQPYHAGRSSDWQKIKCSSRQEFVIGGYTDPQGSRQGLGSLLMGVFENGGFRYVGKVGSGFNQLLLQDLIAQLELIEMKISPFEVNAPKASSKVHWVKPVLIAEIEFSEWTHDQHLRHPVFLGLREDKDATEVVNEKKRSASTAKKKSAASGAKTSAKAKKTSASAKAKSTPATVGGKFRITHPERVVYAKDNFTKLDVANYYKSVAPWILEHLANRPMSLVRCPEGTGQSCFFQKHVDLKHMTAMEETAIRDQTAVSTDSVEGLLQLAQWGVLELHNWQTHIDHAEYPDQIIFDLDPDEKLGWPAVKAAAFQMKDLLERLDLESFVKVTGGKGLHLHVPIAPLYDWEQVKNFAKSVSVQLETENPKLYTTKMAKAGRTGKIFIDYLRNGFGATSVAPYSLRAKDHPYVAVPITWPELKAMKTLKQFTPDETMKRLAHEKKTPWPGVLKMKQKLKVLDQQVKASKTRKR